MPLSRADVEHVAELAHVDLESAEIDDITAQLSSIIDHVQRLQQLDTSGVEPTAQLIPMHNVMRADVAEESWSQAAVLANAPRAQGGLFEVQAVLD